MSTTTLQVQIEETVKQQATDMLAAMGLTLSDAVRIFLTRIVEDKALPFAALHIPNAETQAAMEEAEAIIARRSARFTNAQDVFDALEKDSRQ